MNYRWGAYNEKKFKYNTGIWHGNERKNYYNEEQKHRDWNKVEGTIT